MLLLQCCRLFCSSLISVSSLKAIKWFILFRYLIKWLFAVLTLLFKLSSLKSPYIYSKCIHLASTHWYYCSCFSQRIIMLQLPNPLLSLTGILSLWSVQSHFRLREICTTLVFFLLSISISCPVFCSFLRMYIPPWFCHLLFFYTISHGCLNHLSQ